MSAGGMSNLSKPKDGDSSLGRATDNPIGSSSVSATSTGTATVVILAVKKSPGGERNIM